MDPSSMPNEEELRAAIKEVEALLKVLQFAGQATHLPVITHKHAVEAAPHVQALLTAFHQRGEALKPFAEAARLGEATGTPPFQLVGASDYANARAALALTGGE